MAEELLKIEDLEVYFQTDSGRLKAIDDIDLKIGKSEIVGLVGESASGKSTMALAIMRLLPTNAKIMAGKIDFHGDDLLKLPEKEMRNRRGKDISMIFQDPVGYLNPVLRVGDQIAEVIIRHQKIPKSEAKLMAITMLEAVQIASPATIAKRYPHQLSGGMCQRVLIAIALACNPQLLIADEPTTALDVTVQLEILKVITGLRTKFNLSILLITHDMGVAAEICDRIYIMYAGKIVEEADVFQLFKAPKHPYTQALLNSLLRLDEAKNKVQGIPGSVPNLLDPPSGCRFHPRCPYVMERCKSQEPALLPVDEKTTVACWLYRSDQ